MEAIVLITYPSNIFRNVQNLLEDLKIGKYYSIGEYFRVLAGAFSDAIRQRRASKNIWRRGPHTVLTHAEEDRNG